MSTSRAFKIVARKYAAAHGIGYQRALQILFDPIRSVITQNPSPHIWVDGSEFSPFEWYRAMVYAESDSPVGENFIVTSASTQEALAQRTELMGHAGLTDIWKLRQAERDGSISQAAVEYKWNKGLDPHSITPIILHVPTTSEVNIDTTTVVRYGRFAGIYEFHIGDDIDAASAHIRENVIRLSQMEAIEWVGKLMHTDLIDTYLDTVSEAKHVLKIMRANGTEEAKL